MNQETVTSTPAPERGHPPGLFLLFSVELWERFCFYGMRALLGLYVAAAFCSGSFSERQKEAGIKYGAFTALVYATGIFGGFIADKLLGYRRAVFLGGLFIAAGQFMLLVPKENSFFFGLSLMIIGNGLFKPNISSMVGKLYAPGDPRRDKGFTIFYMGINLGAFLAPVICGIVADQYGLIPALEDNFVNKDGILKNYRYGFLLAGIGMLIGLVTLFFGQHRLGEHGLPPANKTGFGNFFLVALGGFVSAFGVFFLLSEDALLEKILYALMAACILYLLYIGAQSDRVQRQRLWVLIILLFANGLFWALFEQAGNSFNFLAENVTDRNINLFGTSFEFKTAWYQSVNAILIVLLAPVFIWLWGALGKYNPTIPAKFGIALVLLGFGFTILISGIKITPDQGKMAFYFLMFTYLFHTMGELCLSPIGLSMVTKLAPPPKVGFVMGAWFMSVAVGNFVGGKISAKIADSQKGQEVTLADYGVVFQEVMIYAIIAGVVLIVLSRLINRFMHGVK
jgi:POT family proton-dependent oligopeptide transporter